MRANYDEYKVFEKDSKTGKVLIDEDFFVRFFIQDSLKLNKSLTASALKVGAYLLTVLNTNDYQKLPKRKDISNATNVKTKSVIDALNLLVSAKFLIRRDTLMCVNSNKPLDESKVCNEEQNEPGKNIPKYYDDFKINPLYNLHLMDDYRQFEVRKGNEEILATIQKNIDFNILVNYCINNPEYIKIARKHVNEHFCEEEYKKLNDERRENKDE